MHPSLLALVLPLTLALSACSEADPASGASAAGGAGGGGAGSAGSAAGGAGPSAGAAGSGAGAAGAAPGVTFHEHLEPLVQKHCQSCHREGGNAPFSLLSYEQNKTYGALLALRVSERKMPPWGAFETEQCKPIHPFARDLRLSQAEIDTFNQWVSQGMPEGDPARAPQPASFGDDTIDNPTDSFGAPAPYTVKASTKDEFRCFVFDPKLDQNTWINGIQVQPGNNKVVHHVLVFSDEERASLGKAAVNESYSCFGGPGIDGSQKLLLAWAPGAQPGDYPDNIALQVKKDSLLVVQVHYHPTQTTDEEDSTKILMRRAPKSPDWVAEVALIGNASDDKGIVKLLPGQDDPASGPAFVIPPNASQHPETMEFTFPDKIGGFPLPELRLATVGTHMHMVGRTMRIELERKKSTASQPQSECLLETPQWDFNWQRGYSYDLPIDQLPTINAGDKLRMSCVYDNTMSNPFVKKALAEQHMSEPQAVKLGEETLDEMCLGAFIFFRKNFGE